MGAQDLILGSRVMHLRELKAEIEKLKAENKVLREENSELLSHFDFAILAAEDLRNLQPGGRFVIMDGWNLILGAKKEAKNPAELIDKAKAHLEKNQNDKVWIIFDGPKENTKVEGNLRVSYTGGVGAHRADRFICDFLRMARFTGLHSLIDVCTNDKDFKKDVVRLKADK